MVTTLGMARRLGVGAEASAEEQGVKEEGQHAQDEQDLDDDNHVFEEEFEGVDGAEEGGEETVPAVMLSSPEGVCVGADGSIFVTDTVHCCVRKVSAGGRVTNVAGDGKRGQRDGKAEVATYAGADKALAAQLSHPRGIAVDDAGNLFVCDSENHVVRGVSLEGRVSTLAGMMGKGGFKDGPALAGAAFRLPWACCRGLLDGGQALFVADAANHCIRAVHTTASGALVKTIFGKAEVAGSGSCELNFPWSLAYHAGLLYVGDKYNQRVVVLSPEDAGGAVVVSDAWPWASRFAPRGMAATADGLLMSNSFGATIWVARMSEHHTPEHTPQPEKGGQEKGAAAKTGSTPFVKTGSTPFLLPPEKIAGNGLRSYRDGRAELAEFLFPAGEHSCPAYVSICQRRPSSCSLQVSTVGDTSRH